MAFSPEGFSGDLFEQHKKTRLSRDSDDDEIVGMLEAFTAGLHASADTAPRPTMADLLEQPFPMSRTVMLPSGYAINKEKIMKLSRIYREDQILANKMLAMLNDIPKGLEDKEEDLKQRRALNRCALRELITSTTDVHTQQAGLTWSNEGTRSVRNTELLEEFFAICQNPNPAEVAFLAKIGRSDEESVRQWFAWKKDKVRYLFIARGLVKADSNATKRSGNGFSSRTHVPSGKKRDEP